MSSVAGIVIFFFFFVIVVVRGEVLVLTDTDFASKLAEVDLALVKFYAPWCGHCQKMAPEFEKASNILAENDPPIILAKVDCAGSGSSKCKDYGVTAYPGLKMFKNGEFLLEYHGPRDADGIVNFMKSNIFSKVKELTSVEQTQEFLDQQTELTVIGFFENPDSEMVQVFKKLSSPRVRFASTFNPDVHQKYAYKNDIVLFREPKFRSKIEPSELKYAGEITDAKLKEWILSNLHGLVGHRTSTNLEEFQNPLVVVYFDVDFLKNVKGTNYWRNRIIKVARKFTDAGTNVSFAVSNAKTFKNELGAFGLKFNSTENKSPVVAALDVTERKFAMKTDFSVENLEEFVNLFVEGKLKPYVKSEPIPESNDGPVKVVVGETFSEIVNDVTKDVLIEFYSPMCGFCIVLTPKYKKLAIQLQNDTDIVIAKMDATVNEIPEIYELQGFPSIFFVPKESKDLPKIYQGEREVDAFIEFLAKEATSPLKGYHRNGQPRKSKTNQKSDKTEL